MGATHQSYQQYMNAAEVVQSYKPANQFASLYNCVTSLSIIHRAPLLILLGAKAKHHDVRTSAVTNRAGLQPHHAITGRSGGLGRRQALGHAVRHGKRSEVHPNLVRGT
jgi:hypothetical protein